MLDVVCNAPAHTPSLDRNPTTTWCGGSSPSSAQGHSVPPSGGEMVPSQFCPSVRPAHPPLPALRVAADNQTVDWVVLDLG